MALNVDTTTAVRKVLVKGRVDLGKIRLQVAGKTVIIRGRLLRAGDGDPIEGYIIEELERQVMALPTVKFLRWELENWIHELGNWKTRAE